MGYICWQHCFIEFTDKELFDAHIQKVVEQRERRNRRYLYNKLKKEFAPLTK